MTTRDEAISEIKKALKARRIESDPQWSVTGGRGTAWGWITISVAPRYQDDYGTMSEAHRKRLAQLLKLDAVHSQGHNIPASSAYYAEFVARAKGLKPTVKGERYWD